MCIFSPSWSHHLNSLVVTNRYHKKHASYIPFKYIHVLHKLNFINSFKLNDALFQTWPTRTIHASVILINQHCDHYHRSQGASCDLISMSIIYPYKVYSPYLLSWYTRISSLIFSIINQDKPCLLFSHSNIQSS